MKTIKKFIILLFISGCYEYSYQPSPCECDTCADAQVCLDSSVIDATVSNPG